MMASVMYVSKVLTRCIKARANKSKDKPDVELNEFEKVWPQPSPNSCFLFDLQYHRSLKNTELKGRKTKPLKSVWRGRKQLPRKKQQRPKDASFFYHLTFPVHLMY